MTAAMRLAVEGCEATFDPADGGRLSSFRVGDHELLVTRGKDVFHSGSFVIAPWVGRLRDAGLNYGGGPVPLHRQQRATRLARAGHSSAVADHRRRRTERRTR
jgi:galactose mutarotase-like enzyme